MPKQNSKGKKGKGKRQPIRYPLRRFPIERRNSIIGWLPFARNLLATLPVDQQLKTLFNIMFSIITWTVGQTTVQAGAYAAFEITPGSVLKYSPLLAEDSNGQFSFPGHPVRMRSLSMKVCPTSKLSERQGKWAAVFIPYRELHDSTHYTTISKLDFVDVAAMPHAVTHTANRPIQINFKFRNQSEYCSRPRELKEAIGLLYIVWDSSSRANPTEGIDGGLFGCEIELVGECQPYTIFGATHRVKFNPKVFEPPALNSSRYRNTNFDTGKITFYNDPSELDGDDPDADDFTTVNMRDLSLKT